MTYRERLQPTGASVPLLFVASDGTRERGIRILISDVLLWTLQPKPTGDQLPIVAAQLGQPLVVSAIAAIGADGFFAAEGDLDVPLHVDELAVDVAAGCLRWLACCRGGVLR